MEKKFYDLRFAAFCGETNTPDVCVQLGQQSPLQQAAMGAYTKVGLNKNDGWSKAANGPQPFFSLFFPLLLSLI